MKNMYRFFMVIVPVMIFYLSQQALVVAQNIDFDINRALDSVKQELSKAKTAESKYYLWEEIAGLNKINKNNSEWQSAILEMLKYAVESKNDTLLYNSYSYLGMYYEDHTDFSRSIENHLKALNIAEKNNFASAICLSNEQLAVAYKQLHDVEQTFHHLRIAESLLHTHDKEIRERMPWVRRGVFSNMVAGFLQIQEPDSALKYALKTDSVVDKKNDMFGSIENIRNFGNLYAMKGNYKLSESYFKRAFFLADSSKHDMYTSVLVEYAELLLKENKIDSAKKYGLHSLSEHKRRFPDSHYGTILLEIAKVLQDVYSAAKQYDSAFYFAQLANANRDSIFNHQNLSRIQGLTFSQKVKGIESTVEAQKNEINQQKREKYFLLFGIVGALASAFVSYRNFVRKKRDAAIIQEEKQRSESLLLNILPADIAEELKENDSVQAKLFNDVTVLFTDFKDFTKASERLSPQELVDELHTCFKGFDEIITKYNIEKIKTVGDAYLAVSGLPTENPNHAEDMVNAALEIRDFMLKRKTENVEKSFEVRIGIHSGSVVAGIVGVKKFAYDIWGDTVNTAARMEQNSEAGKINLSHTTHDLVSDKFYFQYRGELEAKNKGKLKMYFVER